MAENLIVGQSGGPTAVINSSLFGVIKEALCHNEVGEIYGMIHGIEGFLKGLLLDIRKELESEELELLQTTPGAYLGSCRYKLPEDLSDLVYAELFQKFEKLEIGYFLYIGGNDSMDTVSKLSRYAASIGSHVRIIGLPKTIDNDLVLTDHTPGFGSAAKYVAATVREVSLDANVYDTKSVTIIEIMGRHAGWLTAAGVLARKYKEDNPVLIYLPESVFDQDKFIMQVEKALKKIKNIVVCISEGIKDCDGKFLCEYASSVDTDSFGHKMLNGSGKYLEQFVKKQLGIKARSVELNVCQRCCSQILSAADQQEAIASGAFGVQAAVEGHTGKMVAFQRKQELSYKVICQLVDVTKICNEEKTVPKDWITEEGSNLSEEFLEYVKPLILGDVAIPMEHGLPKFAYRKKI